MSSSPFSPTFPHKVRRQSEQPLLPSLASGSSTSSRKLRSRWTRTLAGSIAAVWIVVVLAGGRARGGNRVGNISAFKALRDKAFGKGEVCEARGSFTPWRRQDEQRRLTIRIRPHDATRDTKVLSDNTLHSDEFHPVLSSQQVALFDNSSSYLPPPLFDDDAERCILPTTHALPLLPKSRVSRTSPTIFFSICTAPDRAVTYAPIWKHFMSAPESASVSSPDRNRDGRSTPTTLDAPGCVVTDAQGRGNVRGMARANAEFRRQGLSCEMKESSRVGERYEMRVLGLVRDAWVESERRRWQEGADLVEWFVFGDDDTWWSDSAMLRDMLSGFDSREDHFFGSFSETRGTVETFGKISFGGGGTIISRGLVRKMQSTLDRCAERFADIFGGDGITSNCAAFTRDMSLDNLVEEVPAMRQMDIRGDATGYLTSGRAPFMSLHHWASWLNLIPDRTPLSSIKLFSRAASIVGGPNFLRRFLFDSGKVEVTLGYAVTLHREALRDEDLGAAEWTWTDHEPYSPARPKIDEGSGKLTYYISSIDRISPELAIFHHTCSHPSLSNSSLKTFSILYDTRTPQSAHGSSWFDSVFGSHDKAVARASPRSSSSGRGRRIGFHA
ncbi:hypothetical protein JCM10212_001403 [Sporobolomyces blumeae]